MVMVENNESPSSPADGATKTTAEVVQVELVNKENK